MQFRRFNASNLKKSLLNPSLILYEVDRIISKYLFLLRHEDGINVMEGDWDNLLILDACRFDYFNEYNSIEGNLRKVISKGGHSAQFMTENFADREFHDTILVTANPFVEMFSEDVFYKVYYAELFEHWDEELNTIPPEAVVEATVKMNERHPNKRLISHFMQPHTPYIGPTGRDLYERYEFGVFNPNIGDNEGFEIPDKTIPEAVRNGPIDEEKLKQAYTENVEIAIEHARELVDELDGKSVITADHGEMLGERMFLYKEYGHTGYVYTPELRMVPWLTVESESRRNIVEGEPQGFDTLDDKVRESRLSALGYV